MLTKSELGAFYFFFAFVFIGAANWGIEAIVGKDLLAVIINAARKQGGSQLQTEERPLLLPDNTASAVVPRVIYAFVLLSAIICAILLIKGAATGGKTI